MNTNDSMNHIWLVQNNVDIIWNSAESSSNPLMNIRNLNYISNYANHIANVKTIPI